MIERIHFPAPTPLPLSHDLIQSASSMLVKSSRKLLDLSPSFNKVSRPEEQTRSFPRGVENKLKYNCGVISHVDLWEERKCLTETLPLT